MSLLVTTEAGYVLWLKKHLLYDLKLTCVTIKCDKTSVISLTTNYVLYLNTKQIKIYHHFLRDHVEKGNVTFEHMDMKNQSVDSFIKLLSIDTFHKIHREFGILDYSCFK